MAQWQYIHQPSLARLQLTNGKLLLTATDTFSEPEALAACCKLFDHLPDMWCNSCDSLEYQLSKAEQQLKSYHSSLKDMAIVFLSYAPDTDKLERIKSILANTLREQDIDNIY